eukprot:CAMPEP_0198206848 /NCGR_PEP_ID=MMETSP1445-20131203/10378_1 /TAXON_ID=36898 /ORGANISM="Pyramimonas sp., Strain CCMP2087" /LENGTH=48 /DNA_ID= /DNA_START= /DNA_END= /DNA_ORIENTATION=
MPHQHPLATSPNHVVNIIVCPQNNERWEVDVWEGNDQNGGVTPPYLYV